MATSTIQQGDVIHHQNTVTLHHLGSLAQLKSDGSLFAYTVSTDNSEDLILYHSQNNGTMDFLLEGENGGSSRESIANLLDEGLGTSLDGTDEISSSIHSTLGRNDSGVFSSDEMTTSPANNNNNGTTQSVTSAASNSPAIPSGASSSSSNTAITTTSNNIIDNSNNTTSVTTIASNNSIDTSTLTTSNTSSTKKQRQKNSSPNRQGPQRCAVCGKIFSNASALTKHKLTHSDERKHACTMCGKAFKRQDHLNGHMLTHRNKKPFECRAKGCGKSYCDGRSLRRHIESRHGPEALATLAIQPTPISSSSSSDVSQPDTTSLSVTATTGTVAAAAGGTTAATAVPVVVESNGSSSIATISMTPGVVVDPHQQQQHHHHHHLNTLPDPGSHDNEMVMDTSGVTTASILGLDSNILENNFVGQPMDIQVALQPVTAGKEEKPTTIKLEPIQIGTDPSQMLGLTLSTVNGTTALCGIVGTGDSSKLINSIAVQPSASSVGNTTAITTTTVPVTIRATHSQLHQLLTQRHSSNVSVGTTAITNASLVTLNPASVTKPQQSDSAGISYEPNWATNENEMTQSKLSNSGLVTGSIAPSDSTTGTLFVGTNGKCPSSPITAASNPNTTAGIISSSSSSSLASPAGSIGTVTQMTATATPLNNHNNNNNNNSNVSSSTPASQSTTPNLLKEQLELIHQIIQQAQEESNLAASALAAGKSGKSKGTSKKARAAAAAAAAAASNNNNGVIIKTEPGEESYKGMIQIEEKPVECTICCRRFKNTPALNGHMRLHGGYFKKDAEGKKKDVIITNKEPCSTPLLTASVSVRALIEEKIIQKRNTIQTQGVEKTEVLIGGTPPCSSEGQTGYGQLICETHENSNSITGLEQLQQQQQQHDQPLGVNIGSTFPNPTNLSLSNGTAQTFHFVYGDDNTDYLLMEEEVFNKVSSICPDSFLNGIDESILNGTGAEQLPPEWNWAATSAGVDSVNSRLTSLFVGADANSPSAANGSFAPLPAGLDGNFYTSPTPQSPSVNSQDSPSFMYPTPPASLESHNALQSPLFPFPNIPAPPTTLATTGVFPYDVKSSSIKNNNASNLSMSNPIITNALSAAANNLNSSNNNANHLNQPNFIGASGFNEIITAALSSPSLLPNDEVIPDVNSVNGSLTTNIMSTSANTLTVPAGVASVIFTTMAGEPILTTAVTANDAIITHDATNFISAKARNLSGGSTSELNILTPSNSPSLGSASTDDSLQSVKELKVNEPSRMDCSGDAIGSDIFISPSSVPNSPCFKSPTKRKQVRNTFASNLRPQTHSPYNSHFTPYPILSPVRSAPGLYWTFSTKLSHVDDAKREIPRINIGSKFQAELPEYNCKHRKVEDCDMQSDEEYRLWRSEVTDTCTSEEVDKYLEFACCSAIPGGGRNKEYALHVLNNCNGDIVDAMVVLMNPCPSLPNNLRTYKYQEKDKWTKEEINIFQEALYRYGKEFSLIAKDIPGKSRDECVIFYHLWKKVCSSDYERVRNVWKKRDAAFTMELLKNVPPPSPPPRLMHNHSHCDCFESKVPNQIMDGSCPLSDTIGGLVHSLAHGEYPCKVCGKVFNKVKSRSAHMKSHRPPEIEGQSSNNKKFKFGLPSSSTVPPTKVVTSPISCPPTSAAVVSSGSVIPSEATALLPAAAMMTSVPATSVPTVALPTTTVASSSSTPSPSPSPVVSVSAPIGVQKPFKPAILPPSPSSLTNDSVDSTNAAGSNNKDT